MSNDVLNARNDYENRAVLYLGKRVTCHSLENRPTFLVNPTASNAVHTRRLGISSSERGYLSHHPYHDQKSYKQAMELAIVSRDTHLRDMVKRGLAIIVTMEVYRSRNNLRDIMHELFKTKVVGNLNLRESKVPKGSVEKMSKYIIDLISTSDKNHRQLPRGKRTPPNGSWVKKPLRKKKK